MENQEEIFINNVDNDNKKKKVRKPLTMNKIKAERSNEKLVFKKER